MCIDGHYEGDGMNHRPSVPMDEVWEKLKSESEESRRFFQSAEDYSKAVRQEDEQRIKTYFNKKNKYTEEL